jgi:hypothetical protein
MNQCKKIGIITNKKAIYRLPKVIESLGLGVLE